MSKQHQQDDWKRVGPVLFYRDCRDDRLELAVVLVRPVAEGAPVVAVDQSVIAAEALHQRDGVVVWRYQITLPAERGGSYRVDDRRYDVAGLGGDTLRLAYVSCNGQESGDRERPLAERNTLWRRLAKQHAAEPIGLLLHGGDQLYADEMLDAHPAARAWADGETTATDLPPPPDLDDALRSFLLRRYLEQYSQPAPSWLLARVPSLCMWDDHDICDGWGSLPPERSHDPLGQSVFAAARQFFLLFQMGCTADDLPPMCLDRTAATLSWAAKLPGVMLIAPDLRSERQRHQILGEAGWAALQRSLGAADGLHVMLIASVPVLGPRLSWVEAVLHLIPGAQKYEDDLRDQWQSRAHRVEWRRLLSALLAVHEQGGSPVTVLSGELHLATHCTMAASGAPLHQLVASGITHPPPPQWYGRLLGTLAKLGESPLPAHRIRLHPLPGQRSIYTAQRNYLMLQRRDGRWTASWELEHDGATPALQL